MSGWVQIIRPSSCEPPCQRHQREQDKPSTGVHQGSWKHLRAAAETGWGLLIPMHHPQKVLRGWGDRTLNIQTQWTLLPGQSFPLGRHCRKGAPSSGQGQRQERKTKPGHLRMCQTPVDQLMKTANKGALQCNQKTYVD